MLTLLQNKGQFPVRYTNDNFDTPGSVGVQQTRRRGAAACAIYTVIYPIRNILRVLVVRKGTGGQTMN